MASRDVDPPQAVRLTESAHPRSPAGSVRIRAAGRGQIGRGGTRLLQRRKTTTLGALALFFAITGTPAIAEDSAHKSPPFLLLKLDGAYVKWGDPVLGTGAAVRYAFVGKDTRIAGARNCEAMTSLDVPLQKFGIRPDRLRSEVAAAFALWERAANIRFVAVENADEAEILIGGQYSPRGRAFANVTYRVANGGATREIEKSLICINQTLPWKVGFGGDANAYDLRYTIAHEIGHAIGLNHPGPSGQLMSFKYAEGFRSLQAGDLEGAIALYGRRNGTATAALPRPRKLQPAGLGLQ
jgi:hypothetical protein